MEDEIDFFRSTFTIVAKYKSIEIFKHSPQWFREKHCYKIPFTAYADQLTLSCNLLCDIIDAYCNYNIPISHFIKWKKYFDKNTKIKIHRNNLILYSDGDIDTILFNREPNFAEFDMHFDGKYWIFN